jgi:hypothetical protein
MIVAVVVAVLVTMVAATIGGENTARQGNGARGQTASRHDI